MTNYEAYLAGLIPDTDSNVARYLKQGELKPRTSLEAAMPVAQAPERKRVWGGKPVDTRGFQQYDPSIPAAKEQLIGAIQGVAPVTRPTDAQAVRDMAQSAMRGGTIPMPSEAEQQQTAQAAFGAIPIAGITTYHGSPTSGIRKWDMGFRGTGEGRLAQGSETYKDKIGHGLYSAEREGIAKGYQERLAGYDPNTITFGGKDYGYIGESKKELRNALKNAGYSDVEAVDVVRRLQEHKGVDGAKAQLEWRSVDEPDLTRHEERVLSALNKMERTKLAGSLYETELLAHPDEFLLWDKPLSESMIKKLEGSDVPTTHMGKPRKGSDVYEGLSQRIGQKAASEYLASKGIAGIKYLDNPSRGAGEGTYNYVTFKPETEAIITHENKQRISGAVEEAYRKMRDPKGKALLEQRYPELKGLK